MRAGDGGFGFAVDDPRRGPFDEDELARAAADVERKKRWHRTNACDWLAVQLQVGRGVKVEQAAWMFSIGDTRVYQKARKEKWPARMSERDRRAMSRQVWLAGVARGMTASADGRESLKAASEWRRFRQRDETPGFVLLDEAGEAPRVRVLVPPACEDSAIDNSDVPTSREISHDVRSSPADPHGEQRRYLSDRLDELIAQYEREDAEARAAEESAAADEVGGGDGRTGEDMGAARGGPAASA